MSSAWPGSTETVGISTKLCRSVSNSSRCELAKDNRLSRFNVVGIQNPPSNCLARACAQIISVSRSRLQDQITQLLLNPAAASYFHRRRNARLAHQKTSSDAPAYIQKVRCFMLFWRSRVSYPKPGPTVRTSDIKVF